MAEMVSSNDFKNGMTILWDDSIYQILEFQHVKPGKGQAFVRTKMKNLRTGSTIEYSFQNGIKIEVAQIEKKKMQYIYNTGSSCAFMDTETYEQVEIDNERLTWELNFMTEGMEVLIVDYEGEILNIIIPEKVEIKVSECDPNVRGNSTQNPQKGAVLETGYKILVPLFINEGDVIIVNTNEGKYCSRA